MKTKNIVIRNEASALLISGYSDQWSSDDNQIGSSKIADKRPMLRKICREQKDFLDWNKEHVFMIS